MKSVSKSTALDYIAYTFYTVTSRLSAKSKILREYIVDAQRPLVFTSAALSYLFNLLNCVLYRFNFLILFTCAALIQKRYFILYHLSYLSLFTLHKSVSLFRYDFCAYGTSGLCPHPPIGYVI